MIKYVAIASFLVIGLLGCVNADSGNPIGNKRGKLVGRQDVYEFRTSRGDFCVYASGYKEGGLQCDFSGEKTK